MIGGPAMSDSDEARKSTVDALHDTEADVEGTKPETTGEPEKTARVSESIQADGPDVQASTAGESDATLEAKKAIGNVTSALKDATNAAAKVAREKSAEVTAKAKDAIGDFSSSRTIACPNCGTNLEIRPGEDTKFCMKCGAPLPETPNEPEENGATESDASATTQKSKQGKAGISRPVIIGIAVAAVLLFVLVFVVAGRGCSSDASSDSSASSGYSENSNAGASYANYDLDAHISTTVYVTSNQLMTRVYDDSGVQAISIRYAFWDAYDEPLGFYDVTYDPTNPYANTIVNVDLKGVANSIAYVYSYKLTDGTVWGNRDASLLETETYGHPLETQVM